MMAIDQRGSAGAGANMIASRLIGSVVRWGAAGGGGRPLSGLGGGGRMGGHVEQKTFRLSTCSKSLLYTVCDVAGAARGIGFGGGAMCAMPVSMNVAEARALKTAQMATTARSIAHRYLRSSVSMDSHGLQKQRRGQRPASGIPLVLLA